jgi:hypothetical protein
MFSTPNIPKRMSQLCLDMQASRRALVRRYMRILTKLRHPFWDGGSTTNLEKTIASDKLPSEKTNPISTKQSYIPI